MAKKTIAELLVEAKQLKQRQIEANKQYKAQKQIIAVEYADNLSPEAKQKQITEAEAILNSAKTKAGLLKADFKTAMKQIKENVAFAKEILAFVNYKQNHSLKKAVNQITVEGNVLHFRREGINDITVDISKANWQKAFKDELAKQGINGDNRIADNIVYKASCMVKGNIKI